MKKNNSTWWLNWLQSWASSIQIYSLVNNRDKKGNLGLYSTRSYYMHLYVIIIWCTRVDYQFIHIIYPARRWCVWVYLDKPKGSMGLTLFSIVIIGGYHFIRTEFRSIKSKKKILLFFSLTICGDNDRDRGDVRYIFNGSGERAVNYYPVIKSDPFSQFLPIFLNIF
jgi:hypothetical protein